MDVFFERRQNVSKYQPVSTPTGFLKVGQAKKDEWTKWNFETGGIRSHDPYAPKWRQCHNSPRPRRQRAILNFTPGPQGDNFATGGQILPLRVKLRMGLRAAVGFF
jgi:hypothetical protein